MNVRLWLKRAVLGAGLLGVALPSSSPAQAPVDTNARSGPSSVTLLKGGELGELLSVYVPRDEAEIQRLLNNAREAQNSSSSEIDGARRLASEADGRLKIMKEELETTKVRRNVANKAKDKAATADLDVTVKRQTRERDYLERLGAAMRADADRLEADRTASSARVKALELELDVARKYAEVSAPGSTPESVGQYRTMLRQLLDAQRQSAERWGDASEKRKLVANRRLKQLQSLSKLSK